MKEKTSNILAEWLRRGGLEAGEAPLVAGATPATRLEAVHEAVQGSKRDISSFMDDNVTYAGSGGGLKSQYRKLEKAVNRIGLWLRCGPKNKNEWQFFLPHAIKEEEPVTLAIRMPQKGEEGQRVTQWVQRAGGGVHAYLGRLIDEPLSFFPQVTACESKGGKGIVMRKAAHVAPAPWPMMSLVAERVLLRVATGAEAILAG